MIKSFKDFDKELKGQKIYEAIGNIKNKKYTYDFSECDSFIPELVSDNDKLLAISNIVYKRLINANIGNFIINPAVIRIDGVPGIHFYNCDDTSMNIIVCRDKYSNKCAYLFRKEIINNINKNEKTFTADLVLSSGEMGFGTLIDNLVSYINPNSSNKFTLHENLILEQEEQLIYRDVKVYGNVFSSKDVAKLKSADEDVLRELINSAINGSYNISSFEKYINANEYIKEEVTSKIGISNAQTVAKIIFVGLGKATITSCSLASIQDVEDDIYNFISGLIDEPTFSGDEGVSDESGSGETGPTGSKSRIDIIKDAKAKLKEEEQKKRAEAKKLKNEIELRQRINEYKKTMNEILDVANSLCKYVKHRGKLANYTMDDKEYEKYADPDVIGGKRALFVTGSASSGKSYSIFQALRDNNMIENVDYFEIGNQLLQADDIYQILYKYNGKLIIFDDTPNVWEGAQRLPLWKIALDNPKTKKNHVKSPRVSELKSGESLEKLGLYSPVKSKNGKERPLTRQEKYFLEIGSASKQEYTQFFAKELEKRYEAAKKILRDEGIYKIKDMKGPLDQMREQEEWDKEIDRKWKIESEKKIELSPTSFYFTGAVIFISNNKADSIAKEWGDDHWGAIEDRTIPYEVRPPALGIWERVKEIIIDETTGEKLTKLKDHNRLVPIKFAKALIDVVENIFKYNSGCNFNFRIISFEMAELFNGRKAQKSVEFWAKRLSKLMKVEWDEKYIENVTVDTSSSAISIE